MARLSSLRLLLLILLVAGLSAEAQVLEQDSLALVDLYNVTGGADWTNNENWLTTAPVSEWYGVTLSGDRVWTLELNNNNLVGSLPASLSDLDGVRVVGLSQNSLSGAIPSDIGNMTRLGVLNLSSNELTGTIPTSIGSCAELYRLYLTNNDLQGAIPAQLFACTNLLQLHLGGNRLTGTVPGSITQLEDLVLLELDNNDLAGTLPPVSSFPDLVSLHLQHSGLTLDLDVFFADTMKKAYYVTLDGMELEGTLRTAYFGEDDLQFLHVGENNLTDVEDFSGFPKIRRLRIHENRLTFEDIVPNRTIEQFYYVDQAPLLEVESRSLNAGDPLRISSGIADPQATYTWYLDGQLLPGQTDSVLESASVTPSDAGVYHVEMTRTEVPDLTLERNPLTLVVTSAPTTNADSLALVALYNATGGAGWTKNSNWLGTAPIGEWQGVTVENGRVVGLLLSDNNMQGRLPDTFWTLDRLEVIHLYENDLTGRVPEEIGNFTELRELEISTTGIGGPIPTQIGACRNLEVFRAINAEFSGPIPEEIFSCRKLKTLNLQDNEGITGMVPSQLETAYSLEVFDISGTGVTGTLPPLGALSQLSQLHLRETGLAIDLDLLFPKTMQSLYYVSTSGVELQGALKTSMFNPDVITFINMEDGELEAVEDFRGMPALRRLSVSGNRLTFDDLLPNRTIEQFLYAPQAPLLEEESRTVNEGESLRISSGIADPRATYTWYRDDQVVAGETDSILTIAAVGTGDGGVYHVEMSRAELPDLTLEREPVTVTVVPDASVDEEGNLLDLDLAVDPLQRTLRITADRATSLRLVTLLGRTVRTITLRGGETGSVTVESAGLYLLVKDGGREVRTIRF